MSKRKTASVEKRGDAIKLVVKSNDLVEAKYMFNIWETRFFLTLVSLVDKEDSEEKVYRVYFNDIKKNFRVNSNKSYYFLKEAAKSLNRKPVYIGWMKDEYRRGREYNLFEFVDYLEDGQKGSNIALQEYVDIKIQKKMRPFLLHVKKNFDPLITRYTSYDLRNTEKLKSYAIRIYELMKQFEYKGFRTIKVDDLKDMFLITNEYPRFSTFNQSVITPSIKAINKHTDLFIPLDRIEKIKKGRKVISLRFVIQTKTKEQVAKIRQEPLQASLFDVEETTKEDELEIIHDVEELVEPEKTEADVLFNEFEGTVVRDFGVTPSVFIRMLTTNQYKKKCIEQAISVTRRAKYNQEIKRSIAGFFIKALKEGFTDEKIEKQRKTELKKLQQRQKEELEKEYRDERAKKIKWILENVQGVREKTIDFIKSKPNRVLENHLRELGLYLENITVADFRNDKILRGFFIQGIAHEFSEYFSEIDMKFNEKMNSFKK